jgi:hypothetical protein
MHSAQLSAMAMSDCYEIPAHHRNGTRLLEGIRVARDEILPFFSIDRSSWPADFRTFSKSEPGMDATCLNPPSLEKADFKGLSAKFASRRPCDTELAAPKKSQKLPGCALPFSQTRV